MFQFFGFEFFKQAGKALPWPQDLRQRHVLAMQAEFFLVFVNFYPFLFGALVKSLGITINKRSQL